MAAHTRTGFLWTRTRSEEKVLTDHWKEMQQRALDLRQRGHTYEEIAEMLRVTPGRAYADCHPEKSEEQIDAWEEKHHPELAAIRRKSRDLMLRSLDFNDTPED